MTTPPQKLPNVKGNSAIAQGFRMTWETLNRLIDYSISITPKPSTGANVSRTPHGTIITPKFTGTETTVETGDEGRWA